jgi:hypothetical protein
MLMRSKKLTAFRDVVLCSTIEVDIVYKYGSKILSLLKNGWLN